MDSLTVPEPGCTPGGIEVGGTGQWTGMEQFETRLLPDASDEISPGGSGVRILLGRPGGSVAHFESAAGFVSKAVAHRALDEIWFVLTGHGAMWRMAHGQEEVLSLGANVCLTIPRGCHCQLRTLGAEPLTAIAVTMPPWPGEEEAVVIEGKWGAAGGAQTREGREHK